jgi:thiaminase/transcriptional activator TenA
VELGQRLEREMGAIPDDHPYAEWLALYRDPEFNEYMDNLLERLQRFADAVDASARRRAKTAFTTSVRYEWMFWEQAWTQQEWPV